VKRIKYVIRDIGTHWCDIGGGFITPCEEAPAYTKSQAAAIMCEARAKDLKLKIEIVPQDQAIKEARAYMKEVNERRAKNSRK
jgi:hypothetical protein